MKKIIAAGVAIFSAALVWANAATAQGNGVGYSPGEFLDRWSWETLIGAVAPDSGPNPMAYQNWCSDAATFGNASATPPIPPGSCTTPGAAPPNGAASAVVRTAQPLLARAQISAQARLTPNHPNRFSLTGAAGQGGPAGICSKVGNPDAGNFPTKQGTNVDCAVEEVFRNTISYNYIIRNNLNTASGMNTAYIRWVTSGRAPAKPIDFPWWALEVKADWVPVQAVVQWLSNNNNPNATITYVQQNYNVETSDGVQYALVAYHISLKAPGFPNWIWATFEHQANPGRCDTMGCYDQFGVNGALQSIPPAATANTLYPACVKSVDLEQMMRARNVNPAWNNYCLKATQVDFVSTQQSTLGRPVLNGNSFVERINANVPISSASCITCHAAAAWNGTAAVGSRINFGQLGQNPIGNLTLPSSAWMPLDFVWGFINMNQN